MVKFFKSLTKGAQFATILVLVAGLVAAFWFIAPGLRVSESITMDELDVDGQVIDNSSAATFMELPSKSPSTKVASQPNLTIAGYAWDCEMPLITAVGGETTMKGSLMEKEGIKLNVVRQDWLSELKAMQMKFIEQYDSGEEYPSSDKAAFAIMMMGDGAPFYISAMQQSINEKFGEGKYHVKVIGSMGMSDGEDKLIGPPEWKSNPQSMLGALISTVPGDGDWVTLLNFCFANGLKVNPNFSTYDAMAVNIFPSKDDDYINSAKELIASQTEGFTVNLKVVKDGELTGETIDKGVDGCATWTPGDVMVFRALTGFTDIASTSDFPNQMATTIIAVDEWCNAHTDVTVGILRATLTASNQLKLYDEWRRRGAEALAETFKIEGEASSPDYWYDIFDGNTGTKAGISYSTGGGRVLNYDDVLQYYGYGTDRTNRYRAVYEQVSGYLTTLNPFGFNEEVGGVVPYNDAVNLSYLLQANIEEESRGVATTYDYNTTKTVVLGKADYQINFGYNSDDIEPSSYGAISSIYNQLVQAEQATVSLTGYTDTSGDDNYNLKLSDRRANSVAKALIDRGIDPQRIQSVQGAGESTKYPSASQNRRVEISLLQ
jgi:outer membrane protein OmpA-like peptidoglycan-associated protein